MGRKPVPIDLDELEKLAALHCTQEEVGSWFGVSKKTICLKLKQRVYAEVWERGWADGNISLRRLQFQAASKGNPALLIWLGKQWLGQKDSPMTEERTDELHRFLDLMEGR